TCLPRAFAGAGATRSGPDRRWRCRRTAWPCATSCNARPWRSAHRPPRTVPTTTATGIRTRCSRRAAAGGPRRTGTSPAVLDEPDQLLHTVGLSVHGGEYEPPVRHPAPGFAVGPSGRLVDLVEVPLQELA